MHFKILFRVITMKSSQLKLLLTVLLTTTFMTNAYSARCKIPKSYYKHVSCTSDKRYFLAKADSGQAVALINRAGKESADLMVYQKVLAHKMGNGLLPVMKRGKVGYINGNGHLIIPFMYDKLNGSSWARGFRNGRAVVKKNGRLGVIDTNNRVIVPFSSRIQGINDFSAGKATMRKNGKRITIDVNGREIWQEPTQKIRPKGATRPKRAKQGLSQRTNNEVVLSKERLNELLRDYKDTPEMSAMQAPQSAMYQPPINNTDMQLFPKQSDGKWGFIDDKNVTMITYSFDEVKPFSEGLAGVRINDKWGFIDKAGDLIVDFNYTDTGVIKDPTNRTKPFVFYQGTAWVGNLRDGTKLCIDNTGKNKPCPSDF